MNELAPLLDFEYQGKARKSTRVCLGDLGTIRETIRRERRQTAGSIGPEALAMLLAQPVKDAELWDYVASVLGRTALLYACAHRADETFTMADAEGMMWEEHEFVTRLFVESHLGNPTPPPTDSGLT